MTLRTSLVSRLVFLLVWLANPAALPAAFEITGRLAPEDPATLVTVQRESLEDRAVSVDHQPAAWRNAIADDHATWLHISDLTGWRSPLAAAYDVSALPASFVLDPAGRIIAKNLRGPALAAKLAELFPDA